MNNERMSELLENLNPPWIIPASLTKKVEGFYRDKYDRLRKVEVIYARGQWLTIRDIPIKIIGWK